MSERKKARPSSGNCARSGNAKGRWKALRMHALELRALVPAEDGDTVPGYHTISIAHAQRELPPGAGQDHSPSSPFNVAPTPPLPPGPSIPGTSLCGLEAIVAMVVFTYTTQRVAEVVPRICGIADARDNMIVVFFPFWGALWDYCDGSGFLELMPLLIYTGCAVWTGVSRILCAWKRSRASSPRETTLELETAAESSNPDGVFYHFDYLELVGFSLNVARAISIWAFYQLISLAFSCVWFLWLAFAFSFSSKGPMLSSRIIVIFALWLWGWAYLLLLKFGLLRRFTELAQECRTQPESRVVQAMLLVSGVGYAIVLYISCAPSVWRLSLAVTHVARWLILFSFL